MEEDWKGELYCIISLKWNYEKGYVDIAMPNYVHFAGNFYLATPLDRPEYMRIPI